MIIDLPGAMIARFSKVLGLSGRDVFDKTGIIDKFDFRVEYAREGADAATDDALPSMDSALAKLGLKLERTKAEREYLIIDHVERPSLN